MVVWADILQSQVSLLCVRYVKIFRYVKCSHILPNNVLWMACNMRINGYMYSVLANCSIATVGGGALYAMPYMFVIPVFKVCWDIETLYPITVHHKSALSGLHWQECFCVCDYARLLPTLCYWTPLSQTLHLRETELTPPLVSAVVSCRNICIHYLWTSSAICRIHNAGIFCIK